MKEVTVTFSQNSDLNGWVWWLDKHRTVCLWHVMSVIWMTSVLLTYVFPSAVIKLSLSQESGKCQSIKMLTTFQVFMTVASFLKELCSSFEVKNTVCSPACWTRSGARLRCINLQSHWHVSPPCPSWSKQTSKHIFRRKEMQETCSLWWTGTKHIYSDTANTKCKFQKVVPSYATLNFRSTTPQMHEALLMPFLSSENHVSPNVVSLN